METLYPIHRIIYISQATRPVSAGDLNSIFLVSRSNNHQLGITGALLYESNHFLQVLEGDQHAVRTIFNRISRDPRHTDVRIAVEDDLAQRQFTRWSMVYCKPPKAHPGLGKVARPLLIGSDDVIGTLDDSVPASGPDSEYILRFQCMLDDFLPAVSSPPFDRLPSTKSRTQSGPDNSVANRREAERTYLRATEDD